MSTYVGLTPVAKSWLRNYGFDVDGGDHEKGVRADRYVMSDTDEGKPIYGNIFHLPPLQGQTARVALELKQVKINGMLCTDLFISERYTNGEERCIAHCCSWVRDLALKDHNILIHYDTGRFCDV